MTHHDPIKFVTMLRDHLARHDRPLVFLFGAGTSCAVNTATSPAFTPLIPAIAPLTDHCKSLVKKLAGKFEGAWDTLEEECAKSPGGKNIENILSRVRMKLQALGSKDTACGLDRVELEKLEKCITDAILEKVNIEDSKIPDSLPHDHFARWVRGHARSRAIEIFTPNYDLLIERSLERALVPVFDGFAGAYRPFFMPELVEREELMPNKEWVRVWKIHGSVNWEIVKDSSGIRICRTSSRSGAHLILPSHLKYDESRKQPYLAMLGRLSQLLDKEDALLIVCGYSFSDDHINAAILGSLERHRRSHTFALMYEDLDVSSSIVKIAKRMRNISAVSPHSAVLGGEFHPWTDVVASPDYMSDAVAASYDFAVPAKPPDPAKQGRLRLGDFNSFCGFLQSMAE